MSSYEIRISRLLPRAPAIGMTDAEWTAIREHALPEGFRYVVDDAEEVVEPILLYLFDKCVGNAKIQSVGNTQLTYCKDLYEWFSYMAVAGLRWDTVSTEDVETYRDRLLGFGRSIATVRKRLIVILDFYKWAEKAGLSICQVDEREVRKIPRENSRDMLAHTNPGERHAESSRLLPKDQQTDNVDALSVDDIRVVSEHLGPSPGSLGDPRPSRDRIIMHLALATGMRVHECVALTLRQAQGLIPNATYGNSPLRITVTKGLNPRTVMIPPQVRADILTYIDTERAMAIRGTGSKTTALFVNAANGNRNRGGPVTAHTVERNFHKAVLAAGLTRIGVVAGPNGAEYLEVAKYSFHDLRHTFAVAYYQELVRQGRSEPWVTLKNLLGHKHLSTTINTYLRSVSSREAEMTDAITNFMRAIWNGQTT